MSQVRLILPIYKEKYSLICIRQISLDMMTHKGRLDRLSLLLQERLFAG